MVSVCRGGVTVEVKRRWPVDEGAVASVTYPRPRWSDRRTPRSTRRPRVPPWTHVSGWGCSDAQPDRWYLPVVPGISTGWLPVRWVRPGRGDRGARGHDRPARRLGHRAVPLLRPAAVGARHRRHRRRRRAATPPRPAPSATSATPRSSPSTPRSATATCPTSGQWATRPTCPPPDDCPPRERRGHRRTRSAPARPAVGPLATPATGQHACCGPACPTCSRCRPPPLAVLGDYVPVGSARRSTSTITSNSLDNTLRRRHARADRVGAGRHPHRCSSPTGSVTASCYLWAEDGTLMATASQSAIVRRARRAIGSRRPADRKGRPMSQRYGMTIPFDSVPLHEQRDWIEELADLGYTDVWSAEADGADAFTPLALASVWAPSLRLGTAIVPGLHPRSGHAWPSASARSPRPRRAGSCSASARRRDVIVERWNGIPFDGALQARPRHGAVPARRAHRREGEARTTTPSRSRASSSASCRSSRCRSSIAALREGMLKLAGREGDGAIINWLSADDVSQVAPVVRSSARVTAPTRRSWPASSWRPVERRRHGAGLGPLRHRRLPERAGLRRVPRVVGPRRAAAPTCGGCGRRATARARWPRSPTRSSTSSSSTARPRSAASTSSATSTTASPRRPWRSCPSPASTSARPIRDLAPADGPSLRLAFSGVAGVLASLWPTQDVEQRKVVGGRSGVSGIQLPWKPKGTRRGRWTRATGSPADVAGVDDDAARWSRCRGRRRS